MAAPLVPDDLWAAIRPLWPPVLPKPKGGRPRVADRVALTGVLFVLRTGIPWREVPAEMGCSSKTCSRRLVGWHATGVWRALYRALLKRLQGGDRLDRSRASLDSASVGAKGEARRPAPVRRTVGWRAGSGTWSSTVRARRSA